MYLEHTKITFYGLINESSIKDLTHSIIGEGITTYIILFVSFTSISLSCNIFNIPS